MTSRRIVATDGASWRYSPDTPPPLGLRSQIMMRARVVDETTGESPDGTPRVTSQTAGAWAVSSDGGLVGVAGRPAALFPEIGIATARVSLLASHDGFLPITLEASLGPQPDFPAAFVLVDLGDIPLRRRPCVVEGGVFSRSAGALSAASIQVTGYWIRQNEIANASATPDMAGLWQSAYVDRAAANVQARDITLAASSQILLRAVAGGDKRLRLSDRQGLVAGQILAIEPGDPERAEYIPIALVDTVSGADQPAFVTLVHAMRRDHPESAIVTRCVLAAPGAASALSRPLRQSDVTVFAAGLAAISPATTHIEITGGGSDPEYHAVGRYVTESDAEGDYRLPPMHRVAAIALRSTHPISLSPIDLVVSLPLGAERIGVDLIYP